VAQDVSEQVGAELQGLLDAGFVSFPSAFTFVARAFTSVDGIARSLDPHGYDFARACEPCTAHRLELPTRCLAADRLELPTRCLAAAWPLCHCRRLEPVTGSRGTANLRRVRSTGAREARAAAAASDGVAAGRHDARCARIAFAETDETIMIVMDHVPKKGK